MKKFFTLLLAFLFIFQACNQSDDSSVNENVNDATLMFQKMKPEATNVTFNNEITETIDEHHLIWESVYNGAGVATADFDNDGLLDLYFTGNQVNDAIYRNKGDWEFEDLSATANITTKAGWSTGVGIGDVNNDGLVDIYVSRMGFTSDNILPARRKNLLWLNQGNFKFKEVAEEYGVADIGHGTQVSFFDYDNDGDLDMYLLNAPSNNFAQKSEYIENNSIPYDHYDKLFRNEDGKKFTDVTKEAGIDDYGYGLGLVTVDINGDNLIDIYVANDFSIADRMFINQGDGTFVDEIASNLKHISFSSMGADIADINNDKYSDIMVLDMQSSDHFRSKTNMPSMNVEQYWTNVARGQHHQFMSNMLQLNNGSGFYSEISQLAGIASTDWSWSVLMADFDQDSYKDIFITNGINKDIRNNDYTEAMNTGEYESPQALFEYSQEFESNPISNIIYKNDPKTLEFKEMNDTWGGTDKGFSFGAAYADMDNDGDLDLIVNNNNAPASLFQNTNNGNYLTVKVTKENHPLYNSKVEAFQNGEKQVIEVSPTRGFQSSVTPYAHFGFVNDNKIDSIVVTFPSGEIVVKKDLPVNQVVQVEYSNSDLKSKPKEIPNDVMFADITGQVGLDFRHTENRYNDFEKESLLPHRQSTQGPSMAAGDVNGDGFDDLYLGNSHGNAGAFYLGGAKGYNKVEVAAFDQDKEYEDQGATFFDYDNDGDLDLYVASGGSEKEPRNKIYQDRLYLFENNSFKRSNNLPANYYNSSCVRAVDFNKDGMMDLFVGGRSVPLNYPAPDNSQLLIRTEKGWKDATSEFAPELANIGMIYDAIWIDVNGDKNDDLIVLGEFMSPEIFIYDNGSLSKKTEEFIDGNVNGWWYSIEAVDLNQDGEMELVVGNIGMNNKYHPNPDHPLKIYGNDFDKNNTPDIVLSKTSDKYGEVPVRGRGCSSQQMPFIKQKFKDFNSFASASIDDIYTKEELENSIFFYADNFYSGYLKMENGKYKFYKFPPMAQISAVRDIAFEDIDNDGDQDIIMIGNMFDAEVETTRHDSSIGMVIENDFPNFKVLGFKESGWYTPGNAREIVKTKVDGKTAFVVSNNSFITQVLTLDRKWQSLGKNLSRVLH